MPTVIKNIFNDLPAKLPQEMVETILRTPTVRIERIVSKGHASPEDFCYDQNESEWVLLLKGKARLRFESGEVVTMQAGDHLQIPAHCKHRVEWTPPDLETIWLAVYYK
jgi:cupin 2 domain-containing protein